MYSNVKFLIVILRWKVLRKLLTVSLLARCLTSWCVTWWRHTFVHARQQSYNVDWHKTSPTDIPIHAYTLLKTFKGPDFQSHIFSNTLGKILPDCSSVKVKPLCLIMQLWQKKKLAKLYFLHSPEGNRPQNTSVSEPLRSWALSCQTRSNTITGVLWVNVFGL